MKVRIYRPAKNPMQSGLARTKSWVLDYELETARTPEPLMGWVSAGDTNNQVRLRFPTAEEAVEYAKEQGWDYEVYPAHSRKIPPRNYVDNFRYIPPKDDATR